MESRQPQEAKPEVPARNAPIGGTATTGMGGNGPGTTIVRRYPKPPALWVRFVMMCIRPETWAEVARYPTRFTLVPLLVAVLLAATVVGFSESARLVSNLKSFAGAYDKQYPPLEFNSDGVLQVKGELANPIRFEIPMTVTGGVLLLIDPTGKTVPETIKESTVVVNGHDVLVMLGGGDAPVSKTPLSKIFVPPALGQTKTFNGTTLKTFFDENGSTFGMGFGLGGALVLALSYALWAAFMMFLISPLIMLAAAGGIKTGDGPDRRLLLPRRAAYRMAGAILVPLLMLDAGLHAGGHPVMRLLGPQGGTLFWFFSASALAIWTGIMARKMYGPKETRRH